MILLRQLPNYDKEKYYQSLLLLLISRVRNDIFSFSIRKVKKKKTDSIAQSTTHLLGHLEEGGSILTSRRDSQTSKEGVTSKGTKAGYEMKGGQLEKLVTRTRWWWEQGGTSHNMAGSSSKILTVNRCRLLRGEAEWPVDTPSNTKSSRGARVNK